MISIIVPIFNMDKYLEKCLESLVNQKNNCDYEILLINDGSTDNSLNICKDFEYRYKNIRVFDTKNQGVSEARNLGLKNASGSHIMFCDADDSYDLHTVDIISKTIEEHNPDLIIFGRKDCLNNKVIADYSTHKDLKIIKNKFTYLEYYFTKGTHSFSVCNKVYKRNIIDKKNILFNKELTLSEDTVFNLKYINQCNTFCENFKISYLRNYIDNSTIYRDVKKFFDKNIYAIETFFNNLDKSEINKWDKSLNNLYYFYGKIAIFRAYSNIDGKNIKERIQTIYNVVHNDKFIYSLTYNKNFVNKKEKILNYLYCKKSSILIYVIFGIVAARYRALKSLIKCNKK